MLQGRWSGLRTPALDSTSHLFQSVSNQTCLHYFLLPEPKRTALRGSPRTQSTRASGRAPLVPVSVSAPPMDFRTSPTAFLTPPHRPRATTGSTRWQSATITETRIATLTTVRSASVHGPSVCEGDRGVMGNPNSNRNS